MKNISLRGKDFKVFNEWGEISVNTYISVVKLYNRLEEMIEEEFLYELLKLLSDIDEETFNGLYDDDLIELTEIVKSFSVNKIQKEKASHFILDGRLYSYEDTNKLTMGEKISLKVLEKNSKDEFDTMLNILSVLIRPAKENINEFEQKEYIVEAFVGDINILTKRKELVGRIPAVNAISILEAFTTGRE